MTGTRRSSQQELVAFAVVGVAGFVVDAAIVVALHRVGAGLILAQIGAFACAVTVTWIGNRSWTFGARPKTLGLRQEWLRYVSASLLGWLANNGVYLVLVLGVPACAREPVMAVAAGSLAGATFNYTASSRAVFR